MSLRLLRSQDNRDGIFVVQQSAALSVLLLVSVAASVSWAHPETGNIFGSCEAEDVGGRLTVTLEVQNTTDQEFEDVSPTALSIVRTGGADVSIVTSPRTLSVLLPGRTATFKWKGQTSGDGFVDLTTGASGTFEDGSSGTSGVVNCNRLTVGDPAGVTPPPTNTPEPRITFQPQPTEPPTMGPAQTPTSAGRPTRTRISTSTPRPTRTPIATSTRRPTRTPIATSTRRPTRTPAIAPTSAAQPTATRRDNSIAPTRTSRPTRTPIGGAATQAPATSPTARPTRTSPQLRPTRTPIPRRPTRTPRGGARITPSGSTGVSGPLSAACSLRQTNDQLAITMIVENNTGVAIQNLAGSTLGLTPEGGALFFDPTGPSPRVHRVLHDGEAARFEWGGRMNDVGAMGFAVAASGFTGDNESVATGLIDCGVGIGPNGFFDSSAFTASCSITPGSDGGMTVIVNNRSPEPLTDIEVFFDGSSGQGTAQMNDLRGPSPRSLRRLAAATTGQFLWEADIRGTGRLAVNFHADGTRESGERISTKPIMCDVDMTRDTKLPDLSVDEDDQRASWVVEEKYFNRRHCAVLEGCINKHGTRKLLKFNTTTPNHGPGDLFLGNPKKSPTMIFSDCHQHYHFEDYADYRLLDMRGNLVARGHKQAFCLVDLWRPPGSSGPRNPKFPDCGFQGITAGWADIYHRDLDCQWIDVTDVPDGRYVLEVHVNPARVIPEADYSNNVARTEVCIGIPRRECD